MTLSAESTTEGKVCPICRGDMLRPRKFCWIISPPLLSLLLVGSKRIYVELSCCSACYAGIQLRRWLTRGLLVAIPLLSVAAFWIRSQWLPHISEARFTIYVVTLAVSLVVIAFARTGLDRVRVTDEQLIERGKQLSRQRLRNAPPWFLAALSPCGAERVELQQEESRAS